MPTFATPGPITATLKLVAGDTRVIAGDRTDTVVEVRPRRAASGLDVKAAEDTLVEFTNDALLVKAPKASRLWGRTGSIEVTIELPAGSHVSCTSAAGDLTVEGELGMCRFTTASGDLRVDSAGQLDVDTPSGDVNVGRVDGNATVSIGGSMRITTIAGNAQLKNLSGDTWVGTCAGELSLNTASGDIVVDKAEQDVTARTASGDVRVLEVVRGMVSLSAASGELEVGIREGSAAWLDVNTMSGVVHSSMTSTDGRTDTADTVHVRATTFSGDILVHRA